MVNGVYNYDCINFNLLLIDY